MTIWQIVIFSPSMMSSLSASVVLSSANTKSSALKMIFCESILHRSILIGLLLQLLLYLLAPSGALIALLVKESDLFTPQADVYPIFILFGYRMTTLPTYKSSPRSRWAPSPTSAAPSKPWSQLETPLSLSPSQTPCNTQCQKLFPSWKPVQFFSLWFHIVLFWVKKG